MAKSLYTIQMDLKKANDAAAKLEKVARELRKLESGKFQTEINGIVADWKGQNANDYVAKCRQLKNKLIIISDQLYKTADLIRTAAKNTYNAERKAYNIALVQKK